MQLRSFVVPLAALALIAVACGSDDDATEADATESSAVVDTSDPTSTPEIDEPESDDAETDDAETDEPAGEALSVVDSTGETIELDAPAERVACLTEPCVDALAELGMTPAAATANRIAALPEFYGDAAEDIPTIGGSFFEPAIEDVIAAEPDLVIGLAGVHEPVRDALGDVPMYVVEIVSTDSAMDFLTDIGVLTAHEDEASTANAEFAAELDAATGQVDPDISAAIVFTGAFGFNINGQDSWAASDMMSQLVEYPFSDDDAASQEGGFATFSVEQLLEADPDYVFVSTIADDGGQGPPSAEVMADDAVWGRLSAVQNGQMIDVRTPLWQYGRGTRSLSIILDEFLAAVG